MQHKSLFIFDIETIPDTHAVRNLTGFESQNEQELREEISRYHLEATQGKNDFPRQPFHKVVAISFVEAEIERERVGTQTYEYYHLKDVRSGGEVDSDEETLVKGFFQYMARTTPRLVSYNGRTFDLPVLKYRAMKYNIAAPWLYQSGDKWNSYTSRYSADWHCDLLEVLSDFGASARVKLNEVCSILGFPGKFGVDGSKVTEMFDNKQVAEIRHYCETDVLNTYLVYLRYQQHTGVLTTRGYNASVSAVITFIEAHQAERPYLADFLAAWHEACDGQFLMPERAL